MTDPSGILGIVVAALGGAAVGVERQRSGHASGQQARFGGVRTFTLLGLTAGIAGWLVHLQYSAFAIVLVAGAVALVIAGYVAASRRDVDATTETAALVVIAAGVSAGLGWLALASGVVAVSTLLLVEKSRLHELVGRIGDEELRAGARFGVMAVVVLPLLPEGPLGPLEIRPRELWLLVLFFTGLSFAGYIARKAVGAGKGYRLAGLLGGLISSTNVTFTFARWSRRDASLSGALAAGAIGASAMLFPRVILATAVLNREVTRALIPYVAAAFAVGAAAFALMWRTKGQEVHDGNGFSNPLQVGPALQMAAVFQVVLLVVRGIRSAFGEGGLLVTGAALGLTDVDALTISMSKMATTGIQADVAARAIAIGILANCMLKAGVAAALGTPRFRTATTAVLLAMAAAIGASIYALR